jgi:hypothetical protein
MRETNHDLLVVGGRVLRAKVVECVEVLSVALLEVEVDNEGGGWGTSSKEEKSATLLNRREQLTLSNRGHREPAKERSSVSGSHRPALKDRERTSRP